MLSDAFYEQAEQDCLNAILVCDRVGCVDWVNQCFTDMSGYQSQEVVGDPVESILRGPETESYGICKLHHGIRKGTGVDQLEMTFYHKKRHPYTVWITAVPVLNPGTCEVDQFIIYQREQALPGWKRIPFFRKIFTWLRRTDAALAPNWELMETQIIRMNKSTGLLMNREGKTPNQRESPLQRKNSEEEAD